MRQRLDWMDFAKGVGIVLVVYGHTLRGLTDAGTVPETSPLLVSDYIIYTFHMPLFFFLSGLTAYGSIDKGTGRFLRSKIGTIVYPYFLWSILQGSVQVALSGQTNHPVPASRLVEILWNPISPFWFLYSLFWIQLIFAALHRIGPRWFLAVAAAGFAVAWPLAPQIVFDTARGLFYFALGSALSTAFAKRTPYNVGTLTGLFGLFLAAALGARWLEIDYSVAIMPALLGIALTVVLGMRFAERLTAVTWIGTMSMSIYVMHILATAGTRIVLSRVFGIENGLVLLGVGTAAGVLFPLGAHVMAARFGISGLLALPTVRATAPRPDTACAQVTR